HKAARPQNTIQRWRGDFKEFAQVMSQGQLVRASAVLQFYVRFSMMQQQAPQGTKWVMLTPPDVPGDHSADSWYGTPPPVTWNLQGEDERADELLPVPVSPYARPPDGDDPGYGHGGPVVAGHAWGDAGLHPGDQPGKGPLIRGTDSGASQAV